MNIQNQSQSKQAAKQLNSNDKILVAKIGQVNLAAKFCCHETRVRNT